MHGDKVTYQLKACGQGQNLQVMANKICDLLLGLDHKSQSQKNMYILRVMLRQEYYAEKKNY